MQGRPGPERTVDFYAAAWIGGDWLSTRRVIAPYAEIEWNLSIPVDDEQLVQTLHRLATRAESITVVSRNYAAGRAALLYDCAAPFGTARFVEFLTVVVGRIAEVRQVHDPIAIRRYFPALLEDNSYETGNSDGSST